MRILITGANGFIGLHLVSALTEQGHQITACVRDSSTYQQYHPFIDAIHCDYTNDTHVDDWLPRLPNIDIVINAVGIIKETKHQKFNRLHRDTPIALFKACEQRGISKVIQVSALGADDTAFSQYHLSKKAADEYLMTLDLNWIIVMPSIVYGTDAKSMSLFTAMAALPVTPIIETGNQAIQPIHINDVYLAINQLVRDEAITNIKIPLVGPTAITMKELYTQLKQWLGFKKYQFISVPFSIAMIMAWFTQFIPNNIVTSESIKMLNKGNTHAVSPFIDTFGFIPMSITEWLKQNPAQQSDRWHAKLTLLRPLLKLSVAFVWIVTGFVSLFVYPAESSFYLLEQVGITSPLNQFVLYAAASLDFIIGLTILVNYHVKTIGKFQIALIVGYTVLISIFLVEQWAHPFGPVSKNIPLLVAILIMISLEDQ